MPARRIALTAALALLFAFGRLGAAAPIVDSAGVRTPQGAAEAPVRLPNAADSLKFVVLGDFGTGGRGQYDLATRMAQFRTGFKFDFVITVGDNLYGSQGPADFKRKFEDPYKPLLDAGVTFHASLGNHDSREQRHYKLFNMDGKLFYSMTPPGAKVRFFMLDSGYPVPDQLKWLESELKRSADEWKIVAFHHPIYSSGGRHGSDLKLREVLEPLFVRYDVSVVFSGHDHFYERIKPQHGIAYFVVGSGGQLAVHDIDKRSALTLRGFDTGNVFLAVEIRGDEMTFNAISSSGGVVDSGIVARREPKVGAP